MARRSVAFLVLIILVCQHACTRREAREWLYVGTFSVRGSQGIYVYRYDRSARRFQPLEQVSGPDSPSFLDLSPDGRFLYSANRGGVGPDSTLGSVCAYRIDSLSGKLQPIGQRTSHGLSPCHIQVDHSGRWLYLSHYAGGSLSVFPVLPDGVVGPLFDTVQHTGRSAHAERQAAPHLHSIQDIPGTDYFLAADLGTDSLYAYAIGHDGIEPAPWSGMRTEAGAGPRHFALLPGTPYVYVAEELSSTVSVYALDTGPGGHSRLLQRHTTLPPGFAQQNTVADIHISPDGGFLYVSNRGHDSLAIFRIDPADGALTFVAHQQTGGKTPRNFLIDPQGTFLLAANQDSDEVIFFARDPATGLLEPTGIKLQLPSPVCLKWLVR